MSNRQPQSAAQKNLVNGSEAVLNGENPALRHQTSAEDMKARFAELKSQLPENWLDLILALYPTMLPTAARRLIDRLKNIFLGRVAPTTEELERFKSTITSNQLT